MRRDLHLCLGRKYNVNCMSFCRVSKYSESQRFINPPDTMRKKVCGISEMPFDTAIQPISMIVTFTIEHIAATRVMSEKAQYSL